MFGQLNGAIWGLVFLMGLFIFATRGCQSPYEKFQERRQERQDDRQKWFDSWSERERIFGGRQRHKGE